jgi:hypothetical protein
MFETAIKGFLGAFFGAKSGASKSVLRLFRPSFMAGCKMQMGSGLASALADPEWVAEKHRFLQLV